jgi:O-antigen ligase
MANIYNYLKTSFLKISDLVKTPAILPYLLAAILIAIPLDYAFGSITSMVFIVFVFSSFRKLNFTYNKALLLPVLFYLLMALSMLWTRDTQLTLSGLRKELPLLFIPLAFLFLPVFNRKAIYQTFRLFGFTMAIYALFYFVKAIFRYISTGDVNVFFYHELVTLDVNAIYVSVFASFAFFYFISIKSKSMIEKTALLILVVLVFLLSSKSIITIDFILIICYYLFFSEIPKGVRATTLATVSVFLIFSLVFVKEVKERFLLEYETAFVDNTVNNKIGSDDAKVYNVSLKQAWYNQKFEPNNFFPGTAMRIYQIRIFKEMLQQDHILFTGYGLEASQDKIREKTVQHNLYPDYGEFNFHNQYIQTFAELGIFGFLILAGMLFFNIKNAWSQKDFLHIAFAITMIILFLTESFFCRQRGVLFFITIYCMFNATRIETKKI